ncbi:MAG: family 43 glycosylhydrolase, partial [Paraprevotella sp.]|nr:family 43 glycosylhydrolase [Paraprevotella sp.]
MKKVVWILLWSCMMVGVLHAQSHRNRDRGTIVKEPLVHDPVMAQEGDTYYLYFTGWDISSMSSKDRVNWKFEPNVFPAPPQWAMDSVPGYKGHTWAPDFLYYRGYYHIFYSCSTFGKNTSAIGHAYRKTLSPEDPIPWTDTGAVIVSHSGDDFNAIDPNVVIDREGHPWLAFGSFWGGIQLTRLTEDLTSVMRPEKLYTICTRRQASSDGKNVSANAVEAPFVFRHCRYYYLFVSYDYCCRGLKSNYKVVVGRSKEVCGPYVDKEGRALDQGGGSVVVDGNDEFVAIGHSAAYHFGKKDYFIAHGYSREQGGASKLFMREMTWDKEDWPVVDAT